MKQIFRIKGYEIVEKKPTPDGTSSARFYVPKRWAGKKVIAILVEK